MWSVGLFAQTSYNQKKGVVLSGYDVVAYFGGEAKKGKKEWSTDYNDVAFYFSSNENLKKFRENPVQYVPQYGGFCAYAMAVNGKAVSVNPKTYEIRDGKLYLFYNAWGNNTLESWRNEDPESLVKKADRNFNIGN